MGAERRQHPRYETDFTVAIEPIAASQYGARDIARLHDISNSGLSFVSRRLDLYTPGQHLQATILPPEGATDSGITATARATIVWTHLDQTADGGVIHVGVSLDEWIDASSLAR